MKVEKQFETQENSPEHTESNTISHMIKQAYQANSEELEKEIKLNHIKAIHQKNASRQSEEPSYREVVETMQALKEKMENKNIEKVVEMLYNKFVIARQQQNSKAEANKKLKCWEDLLEPNGIEIPQISTREYTIRPQIRDKKFIRKEDQQRHLQKQIVAKAFVDRDYGLQHLQNEILQSKSQIIIKRQRYTDLAYGVVTEGYRLLEHFLIHECKRSIKPSDKFEIGALHRVLCNCRILLKPEDNLTFLKFVRIAFDIQSVSVTEEAAVRLYINLQKTIRSRIGNRQLDRSMHKKQWTKYVGMQRRRQFKREDFKKFLTPEMQKQIINLYLQIEMFAKVKAYLIEKYPEQKHLFTLESVSGVIAKAVRISIKRVYYYKEKYKDAGLPEILHLDSSYRCKISKAGEALKARRLLLKFWKSKSKNVLKKIPKIITEINKYIMMKDQQKANYVISKAKPNNNVIEKLDFNINVSRTKLTEGFKTLSQDEVVLKGTERSYQHFINSQNGKKLHYYRKIKQHFNQSFESNDSVKIEGDAKCAKDQSSDSESGSDEEDAGGEDENSQKMSQSGSGESSNKQQVQNDNQNNTQQVIKQWLHRLNLDFFKFDP